jgi:hypothetical protein
MLNVMCHDTAAGGFARNALPSAAQPEKGFGELVRQRRRKRGLPVAAAQKVLPSFPGREARLWSN